MIKAVFYDLDNTLLDFNLNIFLYNYFSDLMKLVSGIAGKSYFSIAPEFYRIMREMMNGRTDDLTNEEFFAKRLKEIYGMPYHDPVIKEAFDFYFYEYAPQSLKRRSSTKPMEGGREAVVAALDCGLDVVLATNPVNPLPITQLRMRWAGVDDLPFRLITHLSNSTRTKPHVRYYREIMEKIGVEPHEVIMVGNDPKMDVVDDRSFGMRTFFMGGKCPDAAAWCGTITQFPEFLRQNLARL